MGGGLLQKTVVLTHWSKKSNFDLNLKNINDLGKENSTSNLIWIFHEKIDFLGQKLVF